MTSDNLTDTEKCGYPANYSADTRVSLEWQVFYGVICSLISVCGAVGNACVIWICLYHRRMRTITNFFIANLAVSDLILCVMNVPPTSYFVLRQNWIFGETACTLVQFIASFGVVASVFTMTVISIDRYIAIVHPLKPRMSRRTAFIIIGGIWTISGLFNMPAIQYSILFSTADNRSKICTIQWSEDWVSQSATIYQTFNIIITYVVPLFVLTFSYGRIAMELWGSKSIGESISDAQMEATKSKQKLVKVLILVMVTFVVCWAPYQLYFVTTEIEPCVNFVPNIAHAFISGYVLAMSTSMFNPVIYFILNQKFRQGFRQIFKWLPCVSWHPAEALDHSAGRNPTNYLNGRQQRYHSTHELKALNGTDRKTSSTLLMSKLYTPDGDDKSRRTSQLSLTV